MIRARFKCVLFFFVLLLHVNSSYAAPITITADYKHYDKYRDVLIAKGNVKVTGPDFVIESPYIIRHFKDEKIVAMDRFIFEREGYRVAGSQMEYYYTTRSGNAEKVRINFGETYLGGRYMTISKDKFELYDAYFTGCNEPSSHYHISAQQVAFYPRTGLAVAYYAACWVWLAPVIPVPTFVYSSPVPKSKFVTVKKSAKPVKASAYGKEKMAGIKSTQPVPELGSNDEDGWFIKQGFNWYFEEKRYLKFLVMYMDKRKFGLGTSMNYFLPNDQSEGEIRLGVNDKDPLYGGLTHYLSLGPKLLTKADEELLVYDFYKPGGKYSYEIELKYSQKERLNYEKNEGPFGRLSFTPKTTLRSNRKPLPAIGEPFTYFWEASYANVSEEVTGYNASDEPYGTTSPRTNYYADVVYKNYVPWFGTFRAKYDVNLTDYGKLGSWDTSRQTLSLSQGVPEKLSIEYGHIHYLMQRGFSPYAFEGYYYSPFDLFFGSLAINAWYSTFRITTAYNLPDWSPFDINYEWRFGMHCYDLIFEYKALRKEFNFSFELEPSRW